MASDDFKFLSKVDAIANFKHSNREDVGHFLSLKIGGEELKPDFNFVNPMKPSEKVPLVCMITGLRWDEKPGGVLMLEGRISALNQGILQDAIRSHDKTAVCEFKIQCYRYDYASKDYYKYCHTNDKVLVGQLSEENTSFVEYATAEDYQQIANHEFTLYVVGSDEVDQTLETVRHPDRPKSCPFGQKAKV